MKSKTKIKEQSARKTNPILQEIIREGVKQDSWRKVVSLLSGPTRKFKSMNLFEIDMKTKVGDSVVIVGKVLSKGELTKKIRICALSFSEKAKEKIKEIKKNPKAEGIRVL